MRYPLPRLLILGVLAALVVLLTLVIVRDDERAEAAINLDGTTWNILIDDGASDTCVGDFLQSPGALILVASCVNLQAGVFIGSLNKGTGEFTVVGSLLGLDIQFSGTTDGSTLSGTYLIIGTETSGTITGTNKGPPSPTPTPPAEPPCSQGSSGGFEVDSSLDGVAKLTPSDVEIGVADNRVAAVAEMPIERADGGDTRVASALEPSRLNGPHEVVVRNLPATPPQGVAGQVEPVAIPRRAPDTGIGAAAARKAPEANAIDSAASGLPQVAGAPASTTTCFEGLDDDDRITVAGTTGSPPDPQLAVGPDHVFEMVNSVGRIYSKSGDELQTFALADFFQVPTGYRNADPKVIYDALSGRWFGSYISFIDNASGPDEGRLHVATSQTSDPTGAWSVLSVSYVDVIPDYPGIGVTNDKFTVSSNVFDLDGTNAVGCSETTGFCGEQTIVFQKSDLVDGLPSVNGDVFPFNPNRFTVRPAHSLSSVDDQYLTTWQFVDNITVIRITGTPDGGDVVEASATNLTTLSQDSPPLSVTAGPGTIDSGDFSMLEAVWRDDSLWSAASAACIPPSDVTVRSCAHLIEVETVGTPSVVQDIMFGDVGEYFSWPAIRTDASGNLYVVLTHTSSSIFAEARVAGRLASDPLNTMNGSSLLHAGEIVHISGRWGDYLGAAVDPSDPSCVWLVGEYAKDTLSPIPPLGDWGTFIAATSYTGGCIPTKQADPGDTDGDGCSDQRENGLDETLGGLRDWQNPHDFYDVLGGGGGPQDGIIDLSNDVLGVIQHYAPTGTEPEYDVVFDRGPSAGPNAWNMTAPDGVIDLSNDILGVIQQYQHDCR